MKKWTQKELQEHIKTNLGEGASYSYGGAVVCAALYKKIYGELPRLGLSGFQASAIDEVLKKMPDPDVDKNGGQE